MYCEYVACISFCENTFIMNRRNFVSASSFLAIGAGILPITNLLAQKVDLNAEEKELLLAIEQQVCSQDLAAPFDPETVRQSFLFPIKKLKSTAKHKLIFINKAKQKISIQKHKGQVHFSIAPLV